MVSNVWIFICRSWRLVAIFRLIDLTCFKVIFLFIFQSLRDKLLLQIAELSSKEGKEKDKKLKELLSKSFLVVKIKALRPVVMAVMKHLSHVDDKYLKVLVCQILMIQF